MDYSITKENENTKELNKEKLNFLSYINTYTKAARHIASNLATLDYLTSEDEFIKNDVKKIFAIAPSFMKATIDNSWAQCILNLNCYYSNDAFGFRRFFKYIDGNWDKIFKNNFFNCRGELTPIRIKYSDVSLAIQEAKQIQEEQNAIIQKIKVFRNNFYAHFANIADLKEYISISVDEIKTLLEATEKIVNKFESLYNGNNSSFTSLNAGDIKIITHCVNEYNFSNLVNEINHLLSTRRKNIILNEEILEEFKNNKVMYQYGLFNKICILFELIQPYLLNKMPYEEINEQNSQEILKNDAIKEAYTMLIVNYLIALLGNKRNDTSSIFKISNECEKIKLEDFIQENQSDYENLYNVRNKVYAHFDFNREGLKDISYQFIVKCMSFLQEYFDRQLEIKFRNNMQGR